MQLFDKILSSGIDIVPQGSLCNGQHMPETTTQFEVIESAVRPWSGYVLTHNLVQKLIAYPKARGSH